MSRLAKLALLILGWASVASAQFTIPQRGSIANVAPQPSGFTHITSSTTGCYDLSTSRTTCAAATHNTPASGDLRLIAVTWKDSGGATTASVTSSNGDTWTSITPGKVACTGGLAGFSVQQFRVFSSGGGADTITVTLSSANLFISWLTDSYTYTGTISGFDGTPVLSNVTASANTLTSSSVTTTNTSDLLWSSCAAVNSNCTVGSGWTTRNDTNACKFDTGTCVNGNNYQSVLGQVNEDKVGIGPGTYTSTYTTPGSTDIATLGLVAI